MPTVRRKRRLSVNGLAEKISDDIVQGRMFPGDKLEEQTLADRFGVSRTPIREALSLLAATGLVEKRPRRGAIVANLSDQRTAELFEAMAEIESVCARLAAERMTKAEREICQTLQKQAEVLFRNDDRGKYETINFEFHSHIYRGTHNEALVEMALDTRRRVAPYRRAQFRVVGRLAKSHSEHQDIVDAILRGDGQGAEEMMRRHLAIVSDASSEFMTGVRTLQERKATGS